MEKIRKSVHILGHGPCPLGEECVSFGDMRQRPTLLDLLAEVVLPLGIAPQSAQDKKMQGPEKKC